MRRLKIKLAIKKVLDDILKYVTGYKEYLRANCKGVFIYPVDLEFTLKDEKKYYFPKDENGVPQKEYQSVGIHYNPTRVAAYGLANWNRYQNTQDEINKENFLKALNWFVKNQKNGQWEYEFDWGDLKAPWVSCMSQGEGISMLVRGYVLTNDLKYLNWALEAIKPFEKMISDGGVRSCLSEDSIFFEEYPELEVKHVLNGFLYSVIGLLELYEVFEENTEPKDMVKKLINESIYSLEKNIERWDCGFWSCYDLHNENKTIRNICTISYHMLHITQLSYIAEKFNSKILEEYAYKWNSYMNSPISRISALCSKILYRIKYPPQR